ncbi:hypothetical protein NFI96_024749 [Prochilodus magdalenae]|nr:hypothetical protein NFI96_024749 [Prochilodus magdalenae]
MVLIEKEWISFGHKFNHRCGHLEGDPREVSPVFTQFVECAWQLSEQFPCAFQFNERFLLAIHDHVYACQYGNFLGNCQKERQEMRLKERTFSLWPFLLQHQDEFRNPLYRRSAHNGVLRPSTLPLHFKFWCGMYNRYDKGMHPRQSVLDTLLTLTHSQTQEEGTMTELQRVGVEVQDSVQASQFSTHRLAPPWSLWSLALSRCAVMLSRKGPSPNCPHKLVSHDLGPESLGLLEH